MKLSRNRWLSLGIAAVVAVDWVSKFWINNRLHLGGRRPLVADWVWLTHQRNEGISFSILTDFDSPLRTPLLVLVACAGVAVALQILRSSRDAWVRAASALVVAGALGNLGDRVMNGAVIDFIVVRFFPFVFNVADVAITLGAVVLAARLARDSESAPHTAG